MSEEEIRTAMRSMFASRMSRQQEAPAPKPKMVVSGGAAKFGIETRFPEYQKSVYNPSSQFGRGRIWILKPNGLLESISVRTGLNDGRYTEIETQRLKVGDQIVLGASAAGEGSTEQARNPFASGGGGRMGGGFR